MNTVLAKSRENERRGDQCLIIDEPIRDLSLHRIYTDDALNIRVHFKV